MTICRIAVFSFVGLLTCVLAAGGCGGDSSSSHGKSIPTATGTPSPMPTPAGLGSLNHIIIVMQENHSFDSYYGVLPYAGPTSYFSLPNPYHPPTGPGGCAANDSTCVDGLTCSGTTPQSCSNFNYLGSTPEFSTHTSEYCLENPLHDWLSMHQKGNYCDPNSTNLLNNGFAELDGSDLPMLYYNETDLPYYYATAETFAISDRHFASLLGPTAPERMYGMAATSFGHTESSPADNQPPGPPGYQPITGSIFDLLDAQKQTWAEYYECDSNGVPPRPYAQLFRYADIPNFVHLSDTNPASPFPEFAAATQGSTCKLPAVSFVGLWNHEHPSYDIQAGQHDVSVLIKYLRTGPCWKDSIMFVTYDEGGGFYDHVIPPLAVSPDGIPPGKCADLSNPPGSKLPGGGANCSDSLAGQQDLEAYLLPGERPANFTQLGFRVPLLAISPFAKPHYVSHVISDHTSILKLIEERFLGGESLTARDAQASDLSDMFDFVNAPSMNSAVEPAVAPTPIISADCPNPLPTPPASCKVPEPLPSPTPTVTPAPTPTPLPACPIPTPTAAAL